MVQPRLRRRDNRVRQKSLKGFESYRVRIMVAFSLMFLGFALIGVRLFSVALMSTAEPEYTYQASSGEAHALRGKIYDAQGQVIATTLKVKSLFADPHHIMDVDEVVQKLEQALPDLSNEVLRAKLKKNSRFVWLKRHLTPQQVYAVNSLGVPGLGFREEEQRFYPQKDIAAHVLGSVNYRGKGVGGVEQGAQEILSQGEGVALTLDMRLQNALHEGLKKSMEVNEAKGAWGVTLDAKSGHILAMVSLPDYNANNFGLAPKNNWLNRTLDGVYEMGSVFKLFTHATAIEHENMKLDQLFDCTRPLKIGSFTIHDIYPRNAWLTAEEVFVYSSNIGAAQMGELVGASRQQDTLAELGLFDQYDSGLGYNAATLAPDPYRWGRIQTMSVSYGHGMAVTALQLAAAARTVLVDGVWRQPMMTLSAEQLPPRKVFSPKTVGMMRQLAAAVVQKGTGQAAAIKGYSVGGKTGTSEKNVDGQYVGDKNLASFVGVAPLNKPRLVTFIMIDEPKEGGGGSVAAPVFAEYTQKALAFLGVPPENDVAEIPSLDDVHPQHSDQNSVGQNLVQHVFLTNKPQQVAWAQVAP